MFLFERPIAHRGLHDETRTENSMAAFKNALEHGYNIETDVHLLKSGEVVIFHDNTLERVCGIKKSISSLTLDDIKSDKYLLPNGEHIPLFEELLELVDGKTGILLELKLDLQHCDHRLEKSVYKLIKGKENWIAVQSFSPRIMTWFNKNAHEFYRGILSDNFVQWLHTLCFRSTKPNFIAFGVKNVKKILKKRDKSGCTLLVWTVRTKEDLQYAIENGVNNVIFEKIIPEENGLAPGILRPAK